MVFLTVRLLRRYPEYWRRFADRCINKRTSPPRYVYLRGWVGNDRRQGWLNTGDHIASERIQVVNESFHFGNKKRLMEEELIEPIKEWTIFPGDRVEVLVGRDRGKQGIVSKIVHERNWIFVEGLNVQYRPGFDAEAPLQEQEMPLDLSSEVVLVDPVTEQPAEKVEWRYTEKGEKVRVFFPSEVILNPPPASEVLADGVEPSIYIENVEKDTTEKQLEEPTYVANLKTFEQDIMDSMGIKETRTKGRTYWY